MISNSKKTTTMTFRLDEDLIERLRIESKNREISTNTLVNQALKRFLEWDMYQTKIGLVSINRPVFVEVFGKFTQKEIIAIASKVGKNEVRDIALFMKGKIDLDSFMSWFEMRMMNSSVQVSHSIEKDSHTYVMKHDLGKNWSIYHKTILELIFDEVLGKKLNVKYNKNMISFQFSK
jgi:predicted transcriptional regulator